MRYREINNLEDFSHHVAVVVDFIGEKEYRQALEKIGSDLNSWESNPEPGPCPCTLDNELFNKLSLVGGQRFPHGARPFDARRVDAQNCIKRRTDHT